MEKLSKASGNLWEIIKIVQSEQNQANNVKKDKREMIFEDEDGFEIFEVGDEPSKNDSAQTSQPIAANAKIRPNDKVTVRYEDGRMEYEVKYKKVKDDVESGKCSVTRIHTD